MRSPNLPHSRLLVVTSVLFVSAACGSDGSNEGSEGAACYGNGTCDEGLLCNADKVCVGPGSSSAGGIDLDACFSCGQSSCPNEASACQDSPGCAGVLECSLNCGADASCLASCDTSKTTEQDQANLGAFEACAVTSCLAECSPDVNAGTPGSPTPGSPTPGSPTPGSPTPVTPGSPTPGTPAGTPTGMACATEGERTGSCATSTLMVCQGGQWLTDPCLICGVVTPKSECADVRLVTLEEQGTADMSNLVGVANPDMQIVANGSTLSAEWYLDANQVGVLQFEFTQAIDPTRIDVQGPGSSAEYVTLETPGGTSGCQYTLSGGRLVRYHKTTGGNIDWYGCWGDFETLTTTEPTTTTIMNVRTEMSTTNELQTMTVSSVLL